jgi:hypothetical protein
MGANGEDAKPFGTPASSTGETPGRSGRATCDKRGSKKTERPRAGPAAGATASRRPCEMLRPQINTPKTRGSKSQDKTERTDSRKISGKGRTRKRVQKRRKARGTPSLKKESSKNKRERQKKTVRFRMMCEVVSKEDQKEEKTRHPLFGFLAKPLIILEKGEHPPF